MVDVILLTTRSKKAKPRPFRTVSIAGWSGYVTVNVVQVGWMVLNKRYWFTTVSQ